MSYSPKNLLGDKNSLAEKLVRPESQSLLQQSTAAYNPAPPDYSKNKYDPQRDRPLPNTSQSNAQVERRTRHEGIATRVDRGPFTVAPPESHVKDLINALSGMESVDYLTPVPKKPIYQRNKLR